MAEVYKLPGSSYEELIKIIRAYAAASKNGTAASLTELSQSSGIERTIISRNNGFLMQTKLVSEGNKKIATDLCMKLGRAYQLNMGEQIIECWNEVIRTDNFLNRMISMIQIKGDMSKGDFVKHIIFSSSNSDSNNTRAGASAIIEILKITRNIEEQEGRVSIGYGNIDKNITKQEMSNEENQHIIEMRRNDVIVKENQNSEKGYYIQTYTCESGKAAKLIIPEDATEDDLLAFCDMLNIVLKRKFKIKT